MERDLCTAPQWVKQYFQALSSHLAPHLLCVKLIFSDEEKHLGWPNRCVQNNEGSDNDAHGKTFSHPRGPTAMKRGRSILNINTNKIQYKLFPQRYINTWNKQSHQAIKTNHNSDLSIFILQIKIQNTGKRAWDKCYNKINRRHLDMSMCRLHME